MPSNASYGSEAQPLGFTPGFMELLVCLAGVLGIMAPIWKDEPRLDSTANPISCSTYFRIITPGRSASAAVFVREAEMYGVQ
jgi:hypothetical protein